jgi:hypothetical protein
MLRERFEDTARTLGATIRCLAAGRRGVLTCQVGAIFDVRALLTSQGLCP